MSDRAAADDRSHSSATSSARSTRTGGSNAAPYLKLALALVLSYVVMYALTFSMVNVIGDVFINLSNAYMALMMVFPMGVIMILVMWKMFPKTGLNIALIAGFVVLFIAALLMGRASAFIGDTEFLHSMIPHHSRAILVCETSNITDPAIEDLCDTIVESQQEEIDQMKRMLSER